MNRTFCDFCGVEITNCINYININNYNPYNHYDLCNECHFQLKKSINKIKDKYKKKNSPFLEIKIGDKIKCLNCKKIIQIKEETFKLNCWTEYIKCPHCNKSYDVQYYHLYGEKVE